MWPQGWSAEMQANYCKGRQSMNQTPEHKLALEVLTIYIKGTPNRAHRSKVWEDKIVTSCLKVLGAEKLFKDHRCSCGSVFAKFGDKAFCIACGNESKDFRNLKFHCDDCSKTVQVSVWSDAEEKNEASRKQYCHGWYCK